MILAELQKKEQRDTKYVIKRNKMELPREEVLCTRRNYTRNINLYNLQKIVLINDT